MARFARSSENGNGDASNGAGFGRALANSNGNGNGNGNGAAPTVTVGVVGLGYWGPNLLRVLIDMPSVHVKYICDLDGERLSRFARRYPGAKATQSVDDLLTDPALDAVCFATPVFTHYDLASRALAAGKHVFVEKPLASSREEADDLVATATSSQLALMCGHTFLYSPPVCAVRDLIQGGELGDIYFITSSRVNLGLHQRDVSVVWDLGPHDFSILLYWLGEEPDGISAVGRDSIGSGVPDVAFIDLTFPSGVLAHVELSWLAPSKLRRTVIVGSEKMVVYDDGAVEPVRVFDHGVVFQDPQSFGQYHLEYRTGDIVSPKLATDEPIARELADFVNTVRSGGPRADHVDIARTVVMIAELTEISMARRGEHLEVREAYA